MFDEGSLCSANGTIHLVNCKEYTVTKVDTITLEIHNEKHYTLMVVWYVPILKKNLISMRLLEL